MHFFGLDFYNIIIHQLQARILTSFVEKTLVLSKIVESGHCALDFPSKIRPLSALSPRISPQFSTFIKMQERHDRVFYISADM